MGTILTKGAAKAAPDANQTHLYYDQDAPGVGTPVKPVMIDESGNRLVLGGFAVKDYRLVKVTLLTSASGTYTPTDGAQALWIEGVAGGGQGGGGPAGTGSAAGGGGGAGAFVGAWITGTLAASYAYACGAGGSTTVAGNSTGQDGADTTFGTAGAQLTAKAGKGGLGHAISTTILTGGLGGAGGLASGCTGDIKVDGAPGGTGIILSTAAGAISGVGAVGLYGGGGGIAAIAQGNGNNGVAYGSGGGGGCTFNSAGATKGGNGGNGAILVYEYA